MKKRYVYQALVAVATIAFGSTATIAGPVSYRTVALSGDAAPGLASGLDFFSFGRAQSDSAGNVFFDAFASNADFSSTASGVWRESGGSIGLVAKPGDAAPGVGAGVTYTGPAVAVQSKSGNLTFNSSLTGPGITSGVNDAGLFRDTGSGQELIVQRGSVTPGAPGQTFTRVTSQAINNNGSNVVYGETDALTDNVGLWKSVGGTLSKVVQAGDFATAAGPGVMFDDFQSIPGIDGSDNIIFHANLRGLGIIPGVNDRSIWQESGGSLTLISQGGDAAPGTDGVFTFVNRPSVNEAGDVAFNAGLTGGSVSAADDTGVWRDIGSGLELIAREGDSVAGLAGISLGVAFAPVLNELGRAAFTASLTGAGIGTSNDRALFAEDLLGNLSVVVRENDVIDLGGGDVRTVSSILYFGSFTDDGQLTFGLNFFDGSRGLFVSSFDEVVAQVPEPAALAILGLGLAGLGLARRGRSLGF